jgi:hypothetical protein
MIAESAFSGRKHGERGRGTRYGVSLVDIGTSDCR